jgi:hypothetical protein
MSSLLVTNLFSDQILQKKLGRVEPIGMPSVVSVLKREFSKKRKVKKFDSQSHHLSHYGPLACH